MSQDHKKKLHLPHLSVCERREPTFCEPRAHTESDYAPLNMDHVCEAIAFLDSDSFSELTEPSIQILEALGFPVIYESAGRVSKQRAFKLIRKTPLSVFAPDRLVKALVAGFFSATMEMETKIEQELYKAAQAIKSNLTSMLKKGFEHEKRAFDLAKKFVILEESMLIYNKKKMRPLNLYGCIFDLLIKTKEFCDHQTNPLIPSEDSFEGLKYPKATRVAKTFLWMNAHELIVLLPKDEENKR